MDPGSSKRKPADVGVLFVTAWASNDVRIRSSSSARPSRSGSNAGSRPATDRLPCGISRAELVETTEGYPANVEFAHQDSRNRKHLASGRIMVG